MRASRAGFTLMEVMIAVSIVAIMGGLIWGAFGPFLRSTTMAPPIGIGR